MAANTIDTNNLQRTIVLNMVMESLLMGKVNLSDLRLSGDEQQMIMEQEICNLRETLDIKNDVIVHLDSRIQKLEKSDSPSLHQINELVTHPETRCATCVSLRNQMEREKNIIKEFKHLNSYYQNFPSIQTEQTALSVSEKYDSVKEVDADMETTYTNTQGQVCTCKNDKKAERYKKKYCDQRQVTAELQSTISSQQEGLKRLESQVSMLESSRRSYPDHSDKVRLQDTDFVKGLENKLETEAAKLENRGGTTGTTKATGQQTVDSLMERLVNSHSKSHVFLKFCWEKLTTALNRLGDAESVIFACIESQRSIAETVATYRQNIDPLRKIIEDLEIALYDTLYTGQASNYRKLPYKRRKFKD